MTERTALPVFAGRHRSVAVLFEVTQGQGLAPSPGMARRIRAFCSGRSQELGHCHDGLVVTLGSKRRARAADLVVLRNPSRE
jgi:hypothetical protein